MVVTPPPPPPSSLINQTKFYGKNLISLKKEAQLDGENADHRDQWDDMFLSYSYSKCVF